MLSSPALFRQADDLVLAERRLMFDTKTLCPLPREVTLQPPVDYRRDHHCNGRAEARQRPVFGGIPKVALCSEIRLAQFAAEDLRGTPFGQFIKHRCRHGEVE